MLGNHDAELENETLREVGFELCQLALCATDPPLALSHVPLRRPPIGTVNPHGHPARRNRADEAAHQPRGREHEVQAAETAGSPARGGRPHRAAAAPKVRRPGGHASGPLVPRELLRCRGHPGLGGVFDGTEQRRCAFGWTGVLILRRQVSVGRVKAPTSRTGSPTARSAAPAPAPRRPLVPRVPVARVRGPVLWLAARKRARVERRHAGADGPGLGGQRRRILPRPRAASGHDGGQRELDGLERLAGHLGLAAGGPVRHAGVPLGRPERRLRLLGQPLGLRPHCLAAGVGADLARLRPRSTPRGRRRCRPRSPSAAIYCTAVAEPVGLLPEPAARRADARASRHGRPTAAPKR